MVMEMRLKWTGGRIGNGYTVMHFRESDVATMDIVSQKIADNVHAALKATNSIVERIPNDVQISIDSEIRNLDTTTGTLLSIHAVDAHEALVGRQPGSFAAPSGAYTTLSTSAVVGGKRLKGRIFWVPLASLAFTESGSVGPTTIGMADATVNAFRDAPGFYTLSVWSRTHGVQADVAAVNTSSRTGTLRTRND